MTTSPKSDLASLKEGTRYLARRPAVTLGIAALGMALFALAALLQRSSGLPDEPQVEQLLTFAALLPLELYFIPRFLIAADAQEGENPLNAPADWKIHFEERWLRAFWGKILLSFATGLGIILFVAPGLLVLMAFGWMPLRILLRGESVAQAARGSLQTMRHAWQRVILTTSAMAFVYLSASYLLSVLVEHFVPDPTPMARLTHPVLWAGNFFVSLLSLWLSACLLALFRRVETAADPADSLPKAG
jgi:hypothetical protein